MPCWVADMPSDPNDPFPPRLSAAESREVVRRRRGRNLALLAVLLALCALFYAIAFVRMGTH